MHSACFYFGGYNVWHKVSKNNFYKVVSNKQLIRCNQQVLFQWTEMIPILNACHKAYKDTFKKATFRGNQPCANSLNLSNRHSVMHLMRCLSSRLTRVFNKLLARCIHSVSSGNGSVTHFVILAVKCLTTHFTKMFLISSLIEVNIQ